MVLAAALSVVLLAGQIPFQALPCASGEGTEWNLYDFKGTEHFKFDVKIDEEEEEIKEGYFTLDLEPEGEETKLKFKVDLDGNTYESTVTVDDKEEIMGSLMGQMMFNPTASSLSFTLFAPWMTMFFMGAGFEQGTNWSFTDDEGTKVSFSVEDDCEHAGIVGTRAIMKENDEVRSEICISKDVALPLKIYFADEDEGGIFEITLTEYEE